MELKTDGTFLRAKKTMELFHRFLMDKKHPAPGTGFTDKITMNVTVIAKTLLSCISHIELRIYLLSKKFLRKKFLNSIGFKNSLSLKKILGFQKVPSVLNSIGFKIPWV